MSRRFVLSLTTAAIIGVPLALGAQNAVARASLLDHLAGKWVLRGTMDGQQTTHDVDAQFVLNRGYIQLHEISREKDAKGAPAYEAIVYISVDEKTGEYACLWLDTTSNAGLAPGAAMGRARALGNSIPFVFKASDGSVFHNTFVYSPDKDAWQWSLDSESNGKLQPFARVTLTRR